MPPLRSMIRRAAGEPARHFDYFARGEGARRDRERSPRNTGGRCRGAAGLAAANSEGRRSCKITNSTQGAGPMKVFFPIRYIDVPASPTRKDNRAFRVAAGIEQWADDPAEYVYKVQMAYNGTVGGRKSPRDQEGTD